MRPPAEATRDPRLDPFRDTGGTVSDGAGRTGVAYISTDIWWSTQAWWKRPRYSHPRELPHLWIELGDDWFHDYVLSEQDIASVVAEWSAGSLGTFNGVTLKVGWRDQESSQQIRERFGL